RVRPGLRVHASLLGDPALASGEEADVAAPARQAAVGMELTHLATLYHDDVVDVAPVRRGPPAAHRLWGISAAVPGG
ncbi:polyprenyl synthetase family protein, partial [Micrococcus sp. GbtcB5]|uniref:polyprenyl synthetase family protein n=1 Tax=Micrococcus sp. GbtcB5 TaxID=2824750 RepID=UPI001C2FB67D